MFLLLVCFQRFLLPFLGCTSAKLKLIVIILLAIIAIPNINKTRNWVSFSYCIMESHSFQKSVLQNTKVLQ